MTISAQNKNGPGAVIFKVIQNQKEATKCHDGASYNKDTCQCECRSNCDCKDDKVFFGYPTCGCRCANAALMKCNPETHHYNEQKCGCECHKKVCPGG